MQHSSRIEQYMIKNSYDHHKKRLSNIKQHHTSFQFYSSSKKQQDRKKLMMIQQRKSQIQHENTILKGKINKIQGLQFSKQIKLKNNTQQKRYNLDNQQQYNPIEFNPEYSTQNFKCFVPPPYHNKKKIPSHLISLKPLNATSIDNFKQQLKTSIDRTGSINPLNIVNKINNKDLITDQISQEQPEMCLDRIILYKKTIMLEPLLSCLIQISKINQRVLIMGYVMGKQNYVTKLYFNPSKSKQILSKYENNMNGLVAKIFIQDHKIKIQNMLTENYGTKSSNCDKKIKTNSEKLQLQQNFIKRNYFLKEVKEIQKTQTSNNTRQAKTAKQITKKRITLRDRFHNYTALQTQNQQKIGNSIKYTERKKNPIKKQQSNLQQNNKNEKIDDEQYQEYEDEFNNQSKISNMYQSKNISGISSKIETVKNQSKISQNDQYQQQFDKEQSLIKSSFVKKQQKKDQQEEQEYQNQFGEEQENQLEENYEQFEEDIQDHK